MGTVSTTPSEEQLSKCLKRNLYEPTYWATGITICGDENMKCSICQEEFIGGQEVGELRPSISTMRHASSSGFGGKTGAPSAGHLLCHCKNFR
ncbi:hypothetical protein B296_00000404 [Ensete ventricosum]|uniref:Uncharacterized protein n=1 Tax=Ensete ventricosum TaxID=4639 RepID=A0A427BCR4_ENSVE|nr:hypothetical protein B296_00000404 [Ensete ventricosum]